MLRGNEFECWDTRIMMQDDLAFRGLKVLDMAQGVAGPHCGLLLAQHGADVVKLEPLGGDWGRALGKRYGDLSAFGAVYNRGKRSIAVDLKTEEGLQVAKTLAAEADVILESFRPGVMARFGLDYETVAKVNPTVVYLSVSGYGQTGPNSKQPVTDSVMQAFSGLMSVNKDDRGMPQRIGVIAIDVFTGLYGFQAVAPALYRRMRVGKGAHLDVSLMQSALAFLSAKMIERHMEGPEPTLLGAPLGTYETSDGYLNMNARRDAHYQALMTLIGRPELANDPRYATPDARVANREELDAIVRPKLKERSNVEWLKDFQTNDILAGPVNDFPDILDDPHVQAREAVRWLEHAGIGSIPMPLIPGAPVPEGDLAIAPNLGQHTKEILIHLGYDESRITSMIETGAALAV
jgi:crotonobetainyl-CoA:carnitine CoA-transferase CaiB-like acyl-CoA transferase